MTVDVVEDIEAQARAAFAWLKQRSGTHSPSVWSVAREVPGVDLRVDACYLSNPYATALFQDYFDRDLVATGRLRDVLDRYPRQNDELAPVLAKHVGVDPRRLVVGNGAAELIHALLARGEGPVLVNVPTFSAYYELAGRRPVVMHQLDQARGFALDEGPLLDAIERHRPTTVVIINPNNPDGGYVERDRLLPLIDAVLDRVAEVVLDESFVHFALDDDGRIPDSTALLQRPGVRLVKSMSKDFGIAGVRVGYAVVGVADATEMRRARFLWNSNGFADYFISLLERPDFVAAYHEALTRYVAATRVFLDRLAALPGLTLYPSRANFALAKLPEGVTADEFMIRALVRYGVYVRNCADKFGLEGEHVRVASRTQAENALVLDAFAECLAH